ncbi:MAG: hypothetical protein WCH11_07975 [Bdellovibrio sp.]
MSCEVLIPQGENSKDLSVGQEFHLRCPKPPLDFNWSQAKLVLTERELGVLDLVSVEQKSSQEVLLRVQTFRPGSHALSPLVFSDGSSQWSTSPIQFQVGSVWKEGEKPQLQEISGLVGLSLHLGLFVGVLIFFLSGAFYFWRQRGYEKRRRTEMEYLLKLESPVSPQLQIYRDMNRQRDQLSPEFLIHRLQIFCQRRWQRKEWSEIYKELEGSRSKELRLLIADLESARPSFQAGDEKSPLFTEDLRTQFYQRVLRFVDAAGGEK